MNYSISDIESYMDITDSSFHGYSDIEQIDRINANYKLGKYYMSKAVYLRAIAHFNNVHKDLELLTSNNETHNLRRFKRHLLRHEISANLELSNEYLDEKNLEKAYLHIKEAEDKLHKLGHKLPSELHDRWSMAISFGHEIIKKNENVFLIN
jgi:hypothetical protein